jgi:hypothetical protein
MDNPVETIDLLRGHKLKIYYDQCAQNPREWSNAGRLIFLGKGCNHLGDKHYSTSVDSQTGKKKRHESDLFSSQMEFLLSDDAKNAALIFVLDFRDFGSNGCRVDIGQEISGQVLAAHADARMTEANYRNDDDYLADETQYLADRFFSDWAEADGFLYITHTIVEGEWGTKPDKYGVTPLERARRYLLGEIETYQQWLDGDVYGFALETPEGEEVDSCWGFYGYDWEENGIYDHIPNELIPKRLLKRIQKRTEQRRKAA